MPIEIAPPEPSAARPRMRPWHAVVAMILSAACWGLATLMTKSALAAIPPFTLLAIQLGASIGFLWLAAIVIRADLCFGRQWMQLALSGLLEPGLAYAAGVPGLALTSAASASVIGASEPAMVAALAWLLLGEKLGWRLVVVIAAAMFGVALVTFGETTGASQSSPVGDLLVALGTAFAALYVISSRLLVARTGPLQLAVVQQTAGFLLALGLGAVAWLFGIERLPDILPVSSILLAVASGVVQYALAFWFYLIGLQILPAGTAAIFLTLVPVFGVAGAMLFLGEKLVVAQGAGCCLIVVAMATVALATRRRAE